METKQNIELYWKWVAPVYGPLCGNDWETEPQDWCAPFVKIKKEVDDETIAQLLWNDNWRCSLVGAWLCFSLNKTHFAQDIGECLLRGKAGVVGYCHALAKFRTPASAQFLTDYLKKELLFDGFPNEKFQDTAYLALLHTDIRLKTSHIQTIQPLWNRFISFEFGNAKKYRFADAPKWAHIEGRYAEFARFHAFMEIL